MIILMKTKMKMKMKMKMINKLRENATPLSRRTVRAYQIW